MFGFSKAAANIAVRGVRQVAVRQNHHTSGPDFHDKYGNVLLASGTLFCAAVWGFVVTQCGIAWNLSPVGKITPKPWRE